MDDKAFVSHRQRALLTVEAVLVPGETFVVHHVGPFAKPCDGVLAAIALLGHISLVAVHTVDSVLMGGEPGPRQTLAASTTNKTF